MVRMSDQAPSRSNTATSTATAPTRVASATSRAWLAMSCVSRSATVGPDARAIASTSPAPAAAEAPQRSPIGAPVSARRAASHRDRAGCAPSEGRDGRRRALPTCRSRLQRVRRGPDETQVFQRAADEVAHIEEGDFGQMVKPHRPRLRGRAGRRRDVRQTAARATSMPRWIEWIHDEQE